MADPEEGALDKTVILPPSAGKKQPAPKARLVCAEPGTLADPAAAEVALEAGEVTLGRGDENSVVLKADGVSRVHAKVFPGDGAWGIEDLGSTNGVKVNGAKIHQTWLKPGDDIALGAARLTYQPAAVPAAERAASPGMDLGTGEQTVIMRPKKRAATGGERGAGAAAKPAAKQRAARPGAARDRSASGGSKAAGWLVVAALVIVAAAAAWYFLPP